MIVLDATIRDGGYYNNWNFDFVGVNEYLKVMEKSKVDAVEIGFRSPLEKNVGLFGKVTDIFIDEFLYIPDIKYFGVMINASEYDLSLAKKMFCKRELSPINLVRAAVHFNSTDHIRNVCDYLKNCEYTVCLNLMQAADKSYDEIRDVARKINEWKSIDVLYIADSLGGMNQDNVDYAFQAVREGWFGLTGFHGHNNKNQALDNTLEAVDIEVDWIDSTIMGMGRGAGNTETEYLLNELNKRNYEFNTELVYELAIKYFYKLKKQYDWGSSLPYYLAAEYNIHPTYIQKMLGVNSIEDVYKSIEFLRNEKCNTFNEELFRRSLK